MVSDLYMNFIHVFYTFTYSYFCFFDSLEKITFEETCCQGFCVKESCCGSSVHCYQVKRRSNKAVFSLGILGTLCIIIGIIGPVIINALLDQGIDDSLVVDSKDASSYDSWSRNNAGTSEPSRGNRR